MQALRHRLLVVLEALAAAVVALVIPPQAQKTQETAVGAVAAVEEFPKETPRQEMADSAAAAEEAVVSTAINLLVEAASEAAVAGPVNLTALPIWQEMAGLAAAAAAVHGIIPLAQESEVTAS